jgi:sulfoxide reductase heme-binding subunit YedZ
MKIARPNYFKLAVNLAALAPLIWLVWAYATNNLTVNPIQAATQRSGKFAIILLVSTLAVTPLYTLTGIRQLNSIRRTLGLYAFFYVSLHFLTFIGLDYRFDWGLVIPEIFAKRYTVVGLTAGLILLPLAITSFRWWMKKMGKNWKRLHRLIYLAGVLVVLHYAWARKGDIFNLSGDILQPLLFGAIVLLLLIMRLPPVRKWVSKTRQRLLKRRLSSPQPKPSPTT